ncbi:MAG TPA: hypothetical protein PKE66_13565, partial [Pyrinomonadaceae bacterium]|nr:hypothetical protein [Pyrinomonadaceae bacterium]
QFTFYQVQIFLAQDKHFLVSICQATEHIGRLGLLLDRTDEGRIALHRQLIYDRRSLELTGNVADQTSFSGEHLASATSEYHLSKKHGRHKARPAGQ